MNVQKSLSNDYFSLSSSSSKQEKQELQSKKGGGKTGLEVLGQGSTQQGMGVSSSSEIYSGLARMVNDPTETEALIRKELLLARSHGTSQIAQSKHFYTTNGVSLSTTETTFPLARIVGGTAIDSRITNTVKLRHTKVRLTISRLPTGTSTATPDLPCFTIVFWRDKIPATVGTAPTIIGTDTIPPSSTTLMFSRLGNGVTYNSIAVLNPITVLDYHIYKVQHVELNDKATYDFATPASAFGLPAPQRWLMYFEIDLHRVEQIYAAYSSTAPDINDLYMTVYVDRSYTNQGFTDSLIFTSDTEFEDVQDD